MKTLKSKVAHSCTVRTQLIGCDRRWNDALLIEKSAHQLHFIGEALRRGGGEYSDRDILEMLKERACLGQEDVDPEVSGITF